MMELAEILILVVTPVGIAAIAAFSNRLPPPRYWSLAGIIEAVLAAVLWVAAGMPRITTAGVAAFALVGLPPILGAFFVARRPIWAERRLHATLLATGAFYVVLFAAVSTAVEFGILVP